MTKANEKSVISISYENEPALTLGSRGIPSSHSHTESRAAVTEALEESVAVAATVPAVAVTSVAQ